MIEIYLQILVNGLIIGSLYALIAVGLSLIYNVNKFINLAHGITITVTAYMLFYLSQMLGLNFFLGAFLSVLFSGIFGVLVYMFLYKPLIKRKTNNIVMLIASFAILLLFENLVLIIFGADVKTYTFDSSVIKFGEIIITNIQLAIISITLTIFVLLWYFLNKTVTGKSIRALSDNKELSEVLGINVEKIIILSFFLASSIAGIGGILIGLEQNLDPSMGFSVTINGFVGAIVGGITSIPGAIGGSYLVGIIENYGVWFLPSQFKSAIVYVVLFLFLLIKPRGLFGIKEREA